WRCRAFAKRLWIHIWRTTGTAQSVLSYPSPGAVRKSAGRLEFRPNLARAVAGAHQPEAFSEGSVRPALLIPKPATILGVQETSYDRRATPRRPGTTQKPLSRRSSVRPRDHASGREDPVKQNHLHGRHVHRAGGGGIASGRRRRW